MKTKITNNKLKTRTGVKAGQGKGTVIDIPTGPEVWNHNQSLRVKTKIKAGRDAASGIPTGK